MAGKTISAYTDEETAKLAEQIARVERRKVSQIAAEALSLYVRLPREAHATLRELEADGDPAQFVAMVQQVTRAIIRSAYDASLGRIADAANAAYGEMSEEEIEAESVRITSSSPDAADGEWTPSAPARGDATHRRTRRRAS